MSKLPELDVPHWAEAMISNYRRSQNLPAHITDRMIFARLEDCRGMEKDDVEACVSDLVEDYDRPEQ